MAATVSFKSAGAKPTVLVTTPPATLAQRRVLMAQGLHLSSPERTANVSSPPERSAVHGEQRRLASARAAGRVRFAIWIEGTTPHGVHAFEEEDELGDVGLADGYAARSAHEGDDLERHAKPRG